MIDQRTMMPLVVQNTDVIDTPKSSPQTPRSNQEEDDPETNNNVNNTVQRNGAETTTTEEAGVAADVAVAANNSSGDVVVDTSAVVVAGTSPLGESSFDDMPEGEGAFIMVGDNDSVSSLDSAVSFADQDSEDEEDHRRHRSHSRRKRERKKGGEPKLRELSPLFKKSSRQQPNRKARSTSTRLGGAENPDSIHSSVRASSWDGGMPMLSPNMPRRQRTREATKRPIPVLARNHSTSDLISPSSNKDKKDKTVSPLLSNNPRESLVTSMDRYSVKSLNCLETLKDEEEHDMEELCPRQLYHQRQTSGQSHCSSSRWQEDCESSANTTSRWSASTGTANRSMNTAQLEVLSTVPRFPRRQKTGDVKQLLRINASSQESSNNGTAANSNHHQDAAAGAAAGMNESSHTVHAPKKRIQLPNRQKSFRRGVLTMNQAAQAALAKASGTPVPPIHHSPNSGGGGQNSPKAPPKQPRRSVSNDASQNSMSKQKSLPNLNPQGHHDAPRMIHNKRVDPLSVSMHNSPRLPTRRASRDKSLCSLGAGLNSSSSHHSRIRRAKSDGAQHILPQVNLNDDSMVDESESTNRSWLGLSFKHPTNQQPQQQRNYSGMTASMQSQESSNSHHHPPGMANSMHSQLSRDESSNQNHYHSSGGTGMASSMHSHFSRESSFSTGMNDSTLPKLPRRQASQEDIPIPAAVATKINHNQQQKQLKSSRDQKMDTIIQELTSNDDESSEYESSEYEEDVEEDGDDQARRRPMDLPPHLQPATRQLSTDSSARLPLRQMSLSEHRDDDDTNNDALHIFNNKASLNALGGCTGLEDDENEEEEDPILLLAAVESPVMAEEEPALLLSPGGGEQQQGELDGEGNKPDDKVEETVQ